MLRLARFTPVALVLVLAAAPGCSQETASESASVMTQLRRDVSEQERANERLTEQLERLERRIDGLTQDIDRLAHARVEAEQAAIANAAAAQTAETSDPAQAAPNSSEAARALAGILESEGGQELVAKAMESIEQRQAAERRERMVTSMLDRFAQEANLTATQTDDMRRVVSESFRKIGELWTSMRDSGDMSAEQRASLRDDNMLKMEEIRNATNDEVKSILNSEQFSLYEEQVGRMRGGFGGPNRGPGRGGFGR